MGSRPRLEVDHYKKEMEQSTQETQIASQGYLQLQEEEANYNACWGLLYPIAHKGNKQSSPWRFNKDKKQYNVGRSASCDVKITGQIISTFSHSSSGLSRPFKRLFSFDF